jgi:curved DNA-binding protein CbpA
MNRFSNCANVDEARKLFRTLSKQFHPDAGGTKEEFQQLQQELTDFINNQNKTNNARPGSQNYYDAQNILQDLLNNLPPEIKQYIDVICETSIYKVAASGIVSDILGFFGKPNQSAKNVENIIRKLKQ